jgi:predicted Ser/Thr protein kinase
MASERDALQPGDRLGDFRIVHQLGEGGMGTVYLANDERLDRPVALKLIAPRLAHDPEFQRRFETEARSAAAIDDPNVVPVYSAGSEGERLFIAMRYVDGTDLRAVLAANGSLDRRDAVAIVADVASALDAAHAAGFVHRDVKPANILLADRVGRRTAFLTDFGLTKGLHGGGTTQLTGTGQWIGTLDYVAPEQMTSGRVDARTDVYALGCVLHEMLTGSVPFPGTDMQKMWAHVNEPLPALGDDAAHPLAEAVERATAKDPDDRYPSAGDLARAAAAAVEGTAISAAERSVATGVAATGLLEAGESSRTRTMKAPPPAPRGDAEARTAAMATAAPRRSHRARGGGSSSARTVAAIGGSVVLAAGLIGAALIFAGGKDSATRTIVSQSAQSGEPPPDREAPTDQGESVSGEAESAAASASSSRSTYSQALYSVEIPSEWVQETDDEPSGSYVESVWRNPSEPNTSITVDAETPAPSVPPIVSAESVRAQTSQSSGYRELSFEPTSLNGLPAARWIFEVPEDRRVDYFVNQCNVGIAILGSTTPAIFGSLAPIFHEAASSVTVPCE